MKAKVRSSLFSEDKRTGKKHFRSAHSHAPELKEIKSQGPFGIVKNSVGLTLTYGFQSVRLDVGAEVPWPCRPGHPEDLKEGFKASDELISDELAERTPELDSFLKDLAKRYR
jgi:hypothetical protein